METHDFKFRCAAISKEPYRSNAQRLKKNLSEGAKQTVVLVPEPDNKYDSHAILVMAQTPTGRSVIGYVPSRRYCRYCDPSCITRGYRAYSDTNGYAVEVCPMCGQELEKAFTERIEPLISQGAKQYCDVIFTGMTEGKENIGAVVNCHLILE